MDMQQNSLIPFAFGDNMVRVLTDEKGEPWFVAKDVCQILELENVTKALYALDDDEKITLTNSDGNPRHGIPHQMTIISESGLYALVFRSRKPEAKAFSKWVRSEVLPSLRKTGTYTMPGVALPDQARHIKPVVRERLLATAQRVVNMSGAGGPEEVEALFLRYCRLVTEGYSESGIACVTSPSAVIDPAMVEKIMRFADDCCEPVAQSRLSASKLYTAFSRWWQRRHDEPAPTINAFGKTFTRRYRKEKRGGKVFYLDVRLAAQ